jgi:hypothetical protein
LADTDPLAFFLEGFNALRVEYMVTGSVAAIVYGELRVTHDVDIVVRLPVSRAGRLAEIFSGAEMYVPPVEVIRQEIGRQRFGHFNLVHGPAAFKADVYLAGDDPLHEWALAHRREAVHAGVQAWFAPPEYVILRKLEFFRDGGSQKHLRDIAWMLHVSRDRIDLPLLEAKVRELGVEPEWEKAKAAPLDL